MRPLCFVLMPFGKKPAAGGVMVDFDVVYADILVPAIESAGLEALRADEEIAGGVIHKPMFERLILCEHAVADLTNANANVFYELGVRHAVRPWRTTCVFAAGLGQLPFDVAPLRALPYSLGPDGRPSAKEADVLRLKARLEERNNPATDSPIFQLVEGFPDIQRLKTDVFRDRVSYSQNVKQRLARARGAKAEAVTLLQEVERSLGAIRDADHGILIDLLLSYRAVGAWAQMIDLVERMPEPLSRTVMVREQFALGLNRAGRSDEAERILIELIDTRGPSSETYGILGRVYKDRWQREQKVGNPLAAQGFLDQAIETYLKGYRTDLRDAYPGINALTLMEIRGSADPGRAEVLAAVSYAVRVRIEAGKPDYWDWATRLELEVLASNEKGARLAAAHALASVREGFEPEATARNLALIADLRDSRDKGAPWLREIIDALSRRGH